MIPEGNANNNNIMVSASVAKMPFDIERNSRAVCTYYFEKAKELMLTNPNDVGCVVIMRTEEEEHFFQANQFMQTDETKDRLSSLLRDISESIKAVSYAFIAETWTVQSASLEEVKSSPPPSQHPDRVECLLTIGQYIGEQSVARLAAMTKDDNKKVTQLVEVLPSNSTDGFRNGVGRFANILAVAGNYAPDGLFKGNKPLNRRTNVN